MRISQRLLAIAVLAAGVMGRPAIGAPQTPECPSAGVPRITAQLLSVSPPSYSFLVTNLARVPISGIVIGRHDRTMPIMGTAPNIPVQMVVPAGWEGRHVHIEETQYLVYLWENKDAAQRVKPQQSIAGFRIDLPQSAYPEQTTFERAPFRASFADGSCRWGFIGVDRLPK